MNFDPFQEMADRLRAASNMKDKAAIAGLTHEPAEEDGIEKSCENCCSARRRRSMTPAPCSAWPRNRSERYSSTSAQRVPVMSCWNRSRE